MNNRLTADEDAGMGKRRKEELRALCDKTDLMIEGYRHRRARRHSWYTAFGIILTLCVAGVCLMIGVS